uniref:DDE_3 domain-containing protein n=1 Tax=Haemonchus contortus TaxID=6289 RepID=A0A7I4Y1D0_HAECO
MERMTSAPRSTIHDILRRRRFRPALPAVIPHTLTESERQVRVDVCRKLLDSKRTVAWTSFIIAQNEKWLSHENPHRKLQWLPIDIRPEAVAKRGAYVKKEMTSFFFCSAACFYYEILPRGAAVTAMVFCKHLRETVSQAPVSHRKGKLLVLMGNARPHHSRLRSWKSLGLPAYSILRIHLTLALATTTPPGVYKHTSKGKNFITVRRSRVQQMNESRRAPPLSG